MFLKKAFSHPVKQEVTIVIHQVLLCNDTNPNENQDGNGNINDILNNKGNRVVKYGSKNGSKMRVVFYRGDEKNISSDYKPIGRTNEKALNIIIPYDHHELSLPVTFYKLNDGSYLEKLGVLSIEMTYYDDNNKIQNEIIGMVYLDLAYLYTNNKTHRKSNDNIQTFPIENVSLKLDMLPSSSKSQSLLQSSRKYLQGSKNKEDEDSSSTTTTIGFISIIFKSCDSNTVDKKQSNQQVVSDDDIKSLNHLHGLNKNQIFINDVHSDHNDEDDELSSGNLSSTESIKRVSAVCDHLSDLVDSSSHDEKKPDNGSSNKITTHIPSDETYDKMNTPTSSPVIACNIHPPPVPQSFSAFSSLRSSPNYFSSAPSSSKSPLRPSTALLPSSSLPSSSLPLPINTDLFTNKDAVSLPNSIPSFKHHHHYTTTASGKGNGSGSGERTPDCASSKRWLGMYWHEPVVMSATASAASGVHEHDNNDKKIDDNFVYSNHTASSAFISLYNNTFSNKNIGGGGGTATAATTTATATMLDDDDHHHHHNLNNTLLSNSFPNNRGIPPKTSSNTIQSPSSSSPLKSLSVRRRNTMPPPRRSSQSAFLNSPSSSYLYPSTKTKSTITTASLYPSFPLFNIASTFHTTKNNTHFNTATTTTVMNHDMVVTNLQNEISKLQIDLSEKTKESIRQKEEINTLRHQREELNIHCEALKNALDESFKSNTFTLNIPSSSSPLSSSLYQPHLYKTKHTLHSPTQWTATHPGIPPPKALTVTEWAKDEDHYCCMNEKCGLLFHPLIRRKHHCRACGGVFCDECTAHQSALLLPSNHHNINDDDDGRMVCRKLRVCDDCYHELLVKGNLVEEVNVQHPLPLSTLSQYLFSSRANHSHNHQFTHQPLLPHHHHHHQQQLQQSQQQSPRDRIRTAQKQQSSPLKSTQQLVQQPKRNDKNDDVVMTLEDNHHENDDDDDDDDEVSNYTSSINDIENNDHDKDTINIHNQLHTISSSSSSSSSLPHHHYHHHHNQLHMTSPSSLPHYHHHKQDQQDQSSVMQHSHSLACRSSLSHSQASVASTTTSSAGIQF